MTINSLKDLFGKTYDTSALIAGIYDEALQEIKTQSREEINKLVAELPDPEVRELTDLTCESCSHLKPDLKYFLGGDKSWADMCSKIPTSDNIEAHGYTFRNRQQPACPLHRVRDESTSTSEVVTNE